MGLLLLPRIRSVCTSSLPREVAYASAQGHLRALWHPISRPNGARAAAVSTTLEAARASVACLRAHLCQGLALALSDWQLGKTPGPGASKEHCRGQCHCPWHSQCTCCYHGPEVGRRLDLRCTSLTSDPLHHVEHAPVGACTGPGPHFTPEG